VPSAVDTEQYRPGGDAAWFRNEFGLTAEQTAIGMIAQLIPRKGHGLLFDALPAVLARHPNTKMLIFGKGPLEEALRQTAKARGMENAVRFAGFRGDLARIIPNLDLVVHPALMEGLGVSLLEAAASGVPIIASRVGGIPEAVKDGVNGYLIEPGDSMALTQKLIDLLGKPGLRREFGAAGRRLVVEGFSIERMVAGNYQIYEAALLSKATGRL
jgi:glycosyltransferase involved in cell wall biosynthesis